LRVPDESKQGTQHVEVFKLTAPPPIYAATGTGGQVFYKVNQPSKDIIPCVLPFSAGDYVCVLGGCSSAAAMMSSYGAGAFATNVLGQPITLYRFLTQTNLATSGGNRPYSGFTTNSSIARVDVFVAGHTAAIDYGAGTGVGTTAAPTLATTARPVLGTTATLSLGNTLAANQGGAIVLAIGRASIPLLGGTILVNPPVAVSFPLPGPLALGATPLNLPIPNDPALLGSPPLDFQGFVLAAPDLAMTNGMEWWFGY
jgi:hypothetical protein